MQEVNFLVSVSLKSGKVFALFVKAPAKVTLFLGQMAAVIYYSSAPLSCGFGDCGPHHNLACNS